MPTQGERVTAKSTHPIQGEAQWLLSVRAQVGHLQPGGWVSVYMAWFYYQLSAGLQKCPGTVTDGLLAPLCPLTGIPLS